MSHRKRRLPEVFGEVRQTYRHVMDEQHQAIDRVRAVLREEFGV